METKQIYVDTMFIQSLKCCMDLLDPMIIHTDSDDREDDDDDSDDNDDTE